MVYYDARGINILGKSVHVDYVGDNARQTAEEKENARIKAEQKRLRKRESDALEKLLTQGSGKPAAASGMNALDQMLAAAKSGKPISSIPAAQKTPGIAPKPNAARFDAGASVGISANNRTMQDIQAGIVDGGRNYNPRGAYHGGGGYQNQGNHGRYDPYQQQRSGYQAGAGGWKDQNQGNQGGGGGGNTWNNPGGQQNNWGNQGGNAGGNAGGWGNQPPQQEAPKKKPNAAFGGLLI